MTAEIQAQKHGPVGYEDYSSYKPWLRDEFVFRCAYCLIRERWYPNGQDSFGVDHFLPRSAAPELDCDYDNLVYACNRCNAFKVNEAGVLDPCSNRLSDHVRFEDSGIATAITLEGQMHVLILELNNPELVRFRALIVSYIRSQLESAPDEIGSGLSTLLGFPSDLPDLKSKRPPKGNTRKAGVENCYFEQMRRGALPLTY